MKEMSLDSLKKEELKHFIFAIIILILLFGIAYPNKILAGLIVIILIYSINLLGYKLGARYFNSEALFTIWGVRHFQKGRFKQQAKSLFNGPIIAIILFIASAGQIFFTAISTFKLIHGQRLGKKMQYISEYETALISSLGLLFVLILTLIFDILNIRVGVFIGTWFLLFNLIPFSDVAGAKIWFGSRTLYTMMLVLTVITLFLLGIANIGVTILTALLAASLIGIIYFYFIEYK